MKIISNIPEDKKFKLKIDISSSCPSGGPGEGPGERINALKERTKEEIIKIFNMSDSNIIR